MLSSAMFNTLHKRQGIVNRRWYSCPEAKSMKPNELFTVCNELVFVDGACSGNGAESATAGIGAAYGTKETDRFSIDAAEMDIDLDAPKTSQRAELVAVVEALEEISCVRSSTNTSHAASHYEHRECRSHESYEKPGCYWVIASDSDYVVRGITEWVPEWKMDYWRNSKGKTPANVDLFQSIDEHLEQLERAGIRIGFWWIPREFNKVADSLAKKAAKKAAKEAAKAARPEEATEETFAARLGGLRIG